MNANPSFDIGKARSEDEAQELLSDAKNACSKLDTIVYDAIKETLVEKNILDKNAFKTISEFVFGTLPIRLVASREACFHAVHHFKESSVPGWSCSHKNVVTPTVLSTF